MAEVLVALRIAFINPVGTGLYDDMMARTLEPFVASGTELDVFHMRGVPEDIAFYYPKHLIELGLLEALPLLEQDGYDAAIIGCCFDPGVRLARELVAMPVVGPFEAAINHASYFGHNFSVVTDSPKTVPWLEDLVRLYGTTQCRGVHPLGWPAPVMVDDPGPVAEAAAATFLEVMERDESEMVLVGCTTIAACLELEIASTGRFSELPFLDPSVLALKAAESLGDLYQRGHYRISRRGFYRRHEDDNPVEASAVRRNYGLIDADGTRPQVVGPNVSAQTKR